LSLTQWIAEHAFRRSENSDILRVFHPPELGRVLWAIASTLSTHATVPTEARRNRHVSLLARKALLSAANNLSIFSTEDLVRIAWAFLELSGSDLDLLGTSEVVALGRVSATTEMSLHRWERGECETDTPPVGCHGDGSVFSSFFGRPRINLPLLEQALNDEEDDDDVALAPLLRKRPKLRDLSIDPSTLCKAACNFQRLSAKHPHINGGWTMTRVAVRLLSSKNARLMKECSIHDITRLCEAAVLSDVDGHGRELIIGLFARQVVKVLNGALDDDDETRDEFSAIKIDSATSSEIVTLIWALGELGVKHAPVGEGRHMANKKMHILHLDLIQSKIQIQLLDLVALHRLVRGLVLMKLTSVDAPVLLYALRRINDIICDGTSAEVLCGVAESIGILKEALKTNERKNENNEKSSVPEPTTQTGNLESLDSVGKDAGRGNLSRLADEVLISIATLVRSTPSKFNAGQIRRLLEVYSLLPFQADEMIDTLAEEVYDRLGAVKELSVGHNLDTLLTNARRKTAKVKSALFEDSEVSLLGSIKNRVLSLFGSDDSDSAIQGEEGNIVTEEVASIIRESIAATEDAADRAFSEEFLLKTGLDQLLRSTRQGTSFELGRSQELIGSYRRIEFSTGTRRSRYDRERRNDIAKRVLSRSLP
jgi:hypothetical protein